MEKLKTVYCQAKLNIKKQETAQDVARRMIKGDQLSTNSGKSHSHSSAGDLAAKTAPMRRERILMLAFPVRKKNPELSGNRKREFDHDRKARLLQNVNAVKILIADQQKSADEQQKSADEQQKSAAEQQKSAAEQQKSAADQQKSATEQHESDAEQQESAAEQQESAAEQQESGAEQQESAAEQQESATEQQESATEQQESATEQQESAAEQQESTAEQQKSADESIKQLLPHEYDEYNKKYDEFGVLFREILSYSMLGCCSCEHCRRCDKLDMRLAKLTRNFDALHAILDIESRHVPNSIERNETEEVESNETVEVEKNETAEVEKNETAEVERNETEEDERNETEEDERNETEEDERNETEEDERNETEEIKRNKTEEVERNETEKMDDKRLQNRHCNDSKITNILHDFLHDKCSDTMIAQIIFNGHGSCSALQSSSGYLIFDDEQNVHLDRIIKDLSYCYGSLPDRRPPYKVDIVFAQCYGGFCRFAGEHTILSSKGKKMIKVISLVDNGFTFDLGDDRHAQLEDFARDTREEREGSGHREREQEGEMGNPKKDQAEGSIS